MSGEGDALAGDGFPPIIVRDSEGPLETPWGSQLRDIEIRLREADGEAVVARRWEFGNHMVNRLADPRFEVSGQELIDEVSEGLGVSEREVRNRIKLAEQYDSETEAQRLATGGTT